MEADTIARLGSIFDIVADKLPSRLVIRTYTSGRERILNKFHESTPLLDYTPPLRFRRRMWGLDFQSNLMNAAGVYANAKDYHIAAMQGAGAFMGPTTTFNYRFGAVEKNPKSGRKELHNPIMHLPKSNSLVSASDLPSEGFLTANDVARIQKVRGVPLGWSFAADKRDGETSRMSNLINVMWYFAEKANVDFMELSEVTHGLDKGKEKEQIEALESRLSQITDEFIVPYSMRMNRVMPVVVKFPNDTDPKHVPQLMDMLFQYGYSGANFGGPTVNQARIAEFISPFEQKRYDFFMANFDSAVSGLPLKLLSRALTSKAVDYLKAGGSHQEFHIFRSGGIATIDDIKDIDEEGVSMNQWKAGYYRNFQRHGHHAYKNLYEGTGKPR